MNEVAKIEPAGVIGVVIRNGKIERVSVNDISLEGLSVVIIDDEQSHKLLRTGRQDDVSTYMEAAREKNAKAGIALVGELAGAQLLEIASTTYDTAEAMAQAVVDTLEQATFLLGKARTGDLPTDEVPMAAPLSEAAEQVERVAEEAADELGEVLHDAPEMEGHESEVASGKGTEGNRRGRLTPIWG